MCHSWEKWKLKYLWGKLWWRRSGGGSNCLPMSYCNTLEKQKPNCGVSKAISFTIRWWKKRDLLIFPFLRILKWKTFMLSRPESYSIHLCLFDIFFAFCIALSLKEFILRTIISWVGFSCGCAGRYCWLVFLRLE